MALDRLTANVATYLEFSELFYLTVELSRLLVKQVDLLHKLLLLQVQDLLLFLQPPMKLVFPCTQILQR